MSCDLTTYQKLDELFARVKALEAVTLRYQEALEHVALRGRE
jgi:hypothetical protein